MGLRCAMIAAVLWSAVTARAGDILVEDIFGRRLNEHGLTLVDWEGPIANPAIKVFVVPPEGVALPASAVLTSTQPRVYFNLPSTIGPRGPSKTLTFNTREKQPVFVSIFPDREAKNLDFTLQLNFKDAAGKKRTLKIPCHVIDQDKPSGDDTAASVFPIDVPPLRQRTEDIPLLVRYLIARYAREAGKSIRHVNKQALHRLQSYPWPGNVRELQNVIERSVIVCESDEFTVDESWLSTRRAIDGPLKLSSALVTQEKTIVEDALRATGGRVDGPSGAAARLGMPRSTLESRIRALRIDKSRFRA